MPHTGWTLEKKPQNRTQQIEMGSLAAADATDWEFHALDDTRFLQHSHCAVL